MQPKLRNRRIGNPAVFTERYENPKMAVPTTSENVPLANIFSVIAMIVLREYRDTQTMYMNQELCCWHNCDNECGQYNWKCNSIETDVEIAKSSHKNGDPKICGTKIEVRIKFSGGWGYTLRNELPNKSPNIQKKAK